MHMKHITLTFIFVAVLSRDIANISVEFCYWYVPFLHRLILSSDTLLSVQNSSQIV